tara:strand:+ start:78 stop:584 length:507 start_codon:yes stop_codon:yes gene_type:complete
MGKHSSEKFTCKVILSVTNTFVNRVEQSVKNSNFDNIIAEQTENCAKVIQEQWFFDRGILGNINNGVTGNGIFDSILRATPLGIVSHVGWTNVTIVYTINVDIYNLIKKNKNTFCAVLSKLMKNKRRKIIMDTMKQNIMIGFNDAIANSPSGILSPAVVTLKSVSIYK